MTEIDELRKEIAELRTDVAGLVELWRTGTGMIKVVKNLARFSTALMTLWAAFTAYLHFAGKIQR